MPNPVPLRRLHSDRTLDSGWRRISLAYWRGQPTARLVESLRPKPGDPGYQEYLKAKPDGTVMQGNTRIKVLQERGYNVDGLPRYPADT